MKPSPKTILATRGAGLSLLLLLFLLVTHTSTAGTQTPGTFSPTGNMATARWSHSATLLPNGTVLITGGSETSSAELYDPSTGTFNPTGSMTGPRRSHTATLLPNGKVLIAGGSNGLALASAELYDPETGTFAATGELATARYAHTATLLDNGKVLIAGGGTNAYLTTAGAEIYDPRTGTFTSTGRYAGTDTLYPQAGGPHWPTATLLPGGKVFIAGVNPAELYDPGTETFSLTGTMTTNSYQYGMFWHTATLLMNGRVLVTGGSDDWNGPLASAELFDPSTATFTAAGNVNFARDLHTSTLLRDGSVLIAGGGDGWFFKPTLANAELYDVRTGVFSATGSMNMNRSGHTATLLQNGMVLVTGGFQYWPYRVLATAELYSPTSSVPPLVVTDVQFDRTAVAAGSFYLVNVSGSNLTPETFFDVRFSIPGSNLYHVALNWQKGPSARHDLSPETASGTWTINGLRPHEDEADHTGSFTSVSATIVVSR